MGKTKQKQIRERIYEVIAKDQKQDWLSKLYDRYTLVLVFLSAVPLVFKLWTRGILLLDRILTVLFILDYILRWFTADFEPRLRGRPKWQAFLLYPFTPMAIVDLLSILPVVMTLSILPDMSITSFIQVLRIMRVFRCARFLKTMRYAKSCVYLYRAFRRERKLLIMVLLLAVLYVFISAAVMFSIEPSTFTTFFDALYWATATLTTVGYGDIHPMTEFGRGVSMVSSIFGIAVVAMPSGIITAGFMEEVNRVRYRNQRKLEEEVEELLDEIHALRQEQQAHGLEKQVELMADQIRQMQEQRENDTVLLRDLSEDLKNVLPHGTITEKET